MHELERMRSCQNFGCYLPGRRETYTRHDSHSSVGDSQKWDFSCRVCCCGAGVPPAFLRCAEQENRRRDADATKPCVPSLGTGIYGIVSNENLRVGYRGRLHKRFFRRPLLEAIRCFPSGRAAPSCSPCSEQRGQRTCRSRASLVYPRRKKTTRCQSCRREGRPRAWEIVRGRAASRRRFCCRPAASAEW